MGDKPNGGAVELESDHAVTAEHPRRVDRVLYVAPTDEGKETRNTIRFVDIPAACWRMDDICFDFASVFLLPAAKRAFTGLARIVEKESEWGKPPQIALFGHADPVDDDAFNKQLSEDRAKIVHAVLVRDVDEWKEVFERRRQVRELQAGLIAYEGDKFGLTSASGTFDARTRSAVETYMNEICPVLDAKKLVFLADGVAAFQGCSEFNPVIVFSKEQRRTLNRPENREERNDENRPNRRVMAFLWRNDARVAKKLWPCKKATEGLKPCQDQFWERKDNRRKPRDYGRQWDRTVKPGAVTPAPPTSSVWTYQPANDTFACRFYQGLALFSPCEFAPPPMQHWRLLINVAENNRLAKPPQRFTMGCEFQFQFLVFLTIAKDKKSGQWFFKKATIADVNTRISPYYDPNDVIVLRQRYLDEARILALRGRGLTGQVELIAGEFIEGTLDANLQRYVKRPDAIYVKLNWPYSGIPQATIRWKLNTTQKEARWVEWERHGKKWKPIHARKDLTVDTTTWHSADIVFSSELGIGHMVPLANGTLDLGRIDRQDMEYWAQIRYHIERLTEEP